MLLLKIIPVGQYGHYIDIDAIIEAAKGLPGKSAYDIAVELGYLGTEAEWLESLKGKSHIDIADFEMKAHTVFDDGKNVKYTPQILSNSLKDTVRTNIGVAPIESTVEAFPIKKVAVAAEEGLTAVRFVELNLSSELKKTARENIDVASEARVHALEVLVAKINSTLGILKYIGPITVNRDSVTLADLSPVTKGSIYNIVGEPVTIHGLSIKDGDWVIATEDSNEGEEPTFAKFGNL